MPAEPILNSVVHLFGASAADLVKAAAPVALSLFVTLATIQVAWDLMMWVLRDEPQVIGKAVRKFLLLSFFYVLIAGYPLWMSHILGGFEALGQHATGLNGLSPSSLFRQGIALGFVVYRVWPALLVAVIPFAGTLQSVTFFTILFAYTVMAIRLAMVLVEGYLVLGGLMVFLAGAGHKATFGLAEGFIRYAVDVGIRIFVVYLLVSVGYDLGIQWIEQVQKATLLKITDPRFHLSIPASAAFFAYIVWTLPKTISGRLVESFSFAGHNPLADA